jgi:hypothetical protein
MYFKMLTRVLVPVIFLAGPNPNAWNMNCNAGQDQQSQQDRSAALLYARRCYLKDVPIPIPVSLNTIPDIIVPSHVVVQRCKGKE